MSSHCKIFIKQVLIFTVIGMFIFNAYIITMGVGRGLVVGVGRGGGRGGEGFSQSMDF